MRTIRLSPLLWLPLLVACSDKAADSGEPPKPASLVIVSPMNEAWYDEGDEVLFLVEGRDPSGVESPVSDVSWISDVWTGTGTEVTTSELPAGIIDFTVQGTVAGEALSEALTITVWAVSTSD